MKRFIAIESDSNTITKDNEIWAREAKYDVVAYSEERALELIKKQGENSRDFELIYISEAKNKMGKYLNESITKLY